MIPAVLGVLWKTRNLVHPVYVSVDRRWEAELLDPPVLSYGAFPALSVTSLQAPCYPGWIRTACVPS